MSLSCQTSVNGHRKFFTCCAFIFKLQRNQDISISITPRDGKGVILKNKSPPGTTNNVPLKHREVLKQKRGSFVYATGDIEVGGVLEICIQSYTATEESPSRVTVNLVSEDDSEFRFSDAEKRQQLGEGQQRKLEVEIQLLREESSRITAELSRMYRRVKSITGDAQYSKKSEQNFHDHSLKLNSAVSFWPLVRLVVVLIGGILQVSHVVDYMKSRHIY